MRKHIRLFALALVPLMVVACQKPNTSSEISGSESSIISSSEESVTTSSTTSEVSTPSSSSIASSTSSSSSSTSSSSISSSTSSAPSSTSIPSSSSSSSSSTSSEKPAMTPEDVKLGELYVAHYWDETIKSVAKRALGDSWEKVPEFIAPSYDTMLKKETVDGQEVLVMEVACYGINPKSCVRLYREKMEQYGYYFSGRGDYGYQMEDYYSDLYLSYEICEENSSDPYFLISAFIKQTREKVWAGEFINLYTGMNIPVCDAKCYYTVYDNIKDTLSVTALFIDRQTALTTYMNQLCNSGFTVHSTDAHGITTLISDDGYLTAQLYITASDYECDALYINFVNLWPSIGITSFVGATNFPKLDSESAIYDGYSYVDSKGQGRDEDYTLCIYYKQASSTDFGTYVNQLAQLGLNKGETVVYDDNVTYSVDLDVTTSENFYVHISVLYRSSTNVLCIVIFQGIILK